VLACEPPIDWVKVKTVTDRAPYLDRDPFCASVLEHEVPAKGTSGAGRDGRRPSGATACDRPVVGQRRQAARGQAPWHRSCGVDLPAPVQRLGMVKERLACRPLALSAAGTWPAVRCRASDPRGVAVMNRRGSKGWPTPYSTSAQTTVWRVPGSSGSVPAALQELAPPPSAVRSAVGPEGATRVEARHRAVRSSWCSPQPQECARRPESTIFPLSL
jgi:hypothetical protein